MRLSTVLTAFALLTSQAPAQRPPAAGRDSGGFQVNLPPGWQAKKLNAGEVVATAPNPSEWVMIAPLLAQTEPCAVSLRKNLSSGWSAYPGIKDLNLRVVRPGLVLADFYFHGGQSRGAVLCADTGPRSGMLYCLAASAAQFAAGRDTMLAVLRSFKYGGGGSPAPRPAGNANLPLESWREPSEGAFVSVKPAGWRVEGGVTRISNTDVRTGFRLTSPDARASIVLGDARLNGCTVPGPNGRQFMNQSPGGGKEWCPYRTGEQVAEGYVQRTVANELGVQGLRITSRRARPDLTAAADRLANMAGPSNFRNATGEVTFTGTRNGVPVSGTFVANTLMLYSAAQDLMVGTYTQEVTGYVGPAEMEGSLADAVGRIIGSMKWNMQWVMANRAAGARDAEMVRRYLASQAQLGQQMFEDRMASADRRAAAVGDLLSGQVRLQDAEGNKYTARAGSNYYFLDEQQARVAGTPSDAVVGSDLWKAAGAVDLRPLETIR
ncbi:MAG: hypothetical protein NTW28_06960 [Candidatus Solibacter sp.]|nr:hypothetical protein [Candidatus Solibacter sp.]